MVRKSAGLSRREFLRLPGLAAAGLISTRLLSACGLNPAASPAIPVDTSTMTAAISPTSTVTIQPTNTSPGEPTATLTPGDIIRFYPVSQSRVIQTHHTGVWTEDKTLVPSALRSMLDASITRLTGIQDALEAWAALFSSAERIAIKVNAFRSASIWTHAELVRQVTDSMLAAGIAPERITIYDMLTSELRNAGYQVNSDGPGIYCRGVENDFDTKPVEIMGKKVYLCNVLKECDALINIPILKYHSYAGISFAMKNHYGSINQPGILHTAAMREVAVLNSVAEIKDRTRLIIGDVLTANVRYYNSFPYWREDWVGDSILMSFDPVAHDVTGLSLFGRAAEQIGVNPASVIGRAQPALKRAVELGLGTDDPAQIEFIEQTIG